MLYIFVSLFPCHQLTISIVAKNQYRYIFMTWTSAFRENANMALKEITRRNFCILLRCVQPSIGLMAGLKSVPFVEDVIPHVEQQPTEERKNNALLNALLEVPIDIQESVMNDFVSALKSSGQAHVANIFRRESDKVPMTDNHYNTLTDNIDQLCQFIDPQGGLLNRLVGTKVLNPADAQDIRTMTGSNEMARRLIEFLARKPDDAFDRFTNALNLTGQSHVTYILTGRGNGRPLKEEHRQRLLTSKRNYLVNMIDSKSSGLITALMDRGVFSDYDEQRVTGVQPDTTNNRNEIILNLIARKSQHDFFSFISALNDTDQTHVVVNLIGANVVAKIKTVYESGAEGERMPDIDAELVEYMRELFQSNAIVVQRLNYLLTHNGVSVSSVREGCIEVTFTCESVQALQNFRELSDSGKLEQMVNETFCSQFASKGLKSLKLEIGNDQFEQCSRMFAQWIPMTTEHRKALLSSEEWLLDKIRVSEDLLDRLSLDKPRRQAIEQAATREQQVKTLLDVVSRRPDSAFVQLLCALRDTGQHEVAAVIGGDRNIDVEVHETCSDDITNVADRDLETLLRLIRKAEAGCSGEGFSTIFNRICVAARRVAMSRRNLREQSTHSAPTSGTSVGQEIEPIVHTPERTQRQLLYGRSKTLCYVRGKLFLSKVSYYKQLTKLGWSL